MANEQRIKAGMSIQDILCAMCSGNPGALTVCMKLLANSERIDPDSFNDGFAAILQLDALGIYEHRIWGLYKDVCGGHLGKMIAVLRANQLGELAGVDAQALNHAIDNQGSLDFAAVIKAVKKRLPNFQLEITAP